jgi:Ca2+/H+ antiporter, TMEM165/GDT1 family
MKIGRRRHDILLCLLASAATISAIGGDLSGSDLGVGSSALGEVGSKPIGTHHAPVDGKDGMPHEGPFVETNADRSRKKYGSDPDEVDTRSPYTKDLSSKGKLPKTNDAVMDDRVNSKVTEGSRGTEGGITQKSKEIQVAEKKPERPTNAPPLPHSEAQRLSKDTDTLDGVVIVEDDAKKPLAVCITT